MPALNFVSVECRECFDQPQPFCVIGIDGAILGEFDDLSAALVEFNRRDEARAISLGSYVVTQRQGGAL